MNFRLQMGAVHVCGAALVQLVQVCTRLMERRHGNLDLKIWARLMIVAVRPARIGHATFPKNLAPPSLRSRQAKVNWLSSASSLKLGQQD